MQFEQNTFNEVVKTFDLTHTNLGLTVNYDKTTVYRMGSIANSDAKMYTVKPFKWTNHPPKVLGVILADYYDHET